MALHGMSKDIWKRYTIDGSWYYEIVAPGYKYNMTDIAAAMGLAQLRKAEYMWRRRLQIAQLYSRMSDNDVEDVIYSVSRLVEKWRKY
jgi:dTDP-4-amino-4,6-dideoxygalactose transaminase